MKLLSVIPYAVALILAFSPAFTYVVLMKFASSGSAFTIQLISAVPMVIGIALLLLLSFKKK